MPRMNLVWWCVLVILALGMLRQEDLKLEASLDYTVRQNKTKTDAQKPRNKPRT
jgi:hypothetical protein